MSTILLTGCMQGFVSLPKEERYQYIHQVEKDLDLESAGRIDEKTYDDNDGVFNESYLKIKVTGNETYTIVNERLKSIATIPCREDTTKLILECGVGQVLVEVRKDSLESPIVYIKIADHFSGRDAR